MSRFFVTSTLVAVLATNVVACPPQGEDIRKATRLLENLRHRKMKTDGQGHVWYLDISEQDAVSDKTIAAVVHLPHLREIYAIFCPIRGDGLAHLAGLKHIEKLDLYATQIDDKALEHVAKLPTLKYLDIRSIGVTDKGIVTNSHGSISDDGIGLVADHLPNLESLLFCGTVTDHGLLQLVKLRKLSYVEIGSPRVTSEGIKRLQKAIPNLEIDW
ncbi:MAG: hypothetical protein O3C40_30550 [Planctomycetota bacterium]|nr:hypothetical protein [Planctomycetota bacterium]